MIMYYKFKMGLLTSIIICIILWIYYIYLSHPKFKTYEFDELKHKFKTGDIILFHALDNINPIFIGTYYGHIGIIYIDPNDNKQKPYIFEAFNPGTMPFFPNECQSGVVLVDLEHRLNSYRGYCFYKELQNPVDIKLQTEFKDFIDYALTNMYYNQSVISNGISKLIFNEELHHGTNCAELVYLSLIKLGILDIDNLSCNRKHHLSWLANLTDGYNEPVYILSNYFKLY